MIRMSRAHFWTLSLAALAAVCPALGSVAHAAGTPVELRADISDGDGRITLGEVFDNAGAAAGVVIGTRNGPSAVLDAGRLQALAARSGLIWTNTAGIRRVIVRQGVEAMGASANAASPASTSRPASLQTASARQTEVLVLTRPLMAGDVVRPEDLSWVKVDSHLVRPGGIQDPARAIGKTARYALRVGVPVADRDLAAPMVIKKNEAVQVTWRSGGVTLAMTGLAQSDAAAGQPFAILNPQSKKTIDAVATGPGQAVAGPEALAVRANASNSF